MTGSKIDQYLAFATQEQLQAGATPKQATPSLHPDLQQLMMRNMHTCLLCAAQPVDCLPYAPDMALFSAAFCTGSRGSNLAKLLAAQVLRLFSSQRLVLNFQLTKTRQYGAAHASLLGPGLDMPETFCAVVAMVRYLPAADLCEWDLSTGYFSSEMRASRDLTLNRLSGPLSAKPWPRVLTEHSEHADLRGVLSHLSFILARLRRYTGYHSQEYCGDYGVP